MMQILSIDLENRSFTREHREDLVHFLGGVGVATALLKEHLAGGKKPGNPVEPLEPLERLESLDPPGPEQPVILAIGPLAGLFPAATKAVAMFVSPLTKELGESYAGLGLAMAMSMAGIRAVVIRGKSGQPVWLKISSQGVEFFDARNLWGMSCQETGRVLDQMRERDQIRERDQMRETDRPFGGVGYSRLCIGPAGEKGVAFASATVDSYRHFGRLGLGAVLGSKNVKAVVIQENGHIQEEGQTALKEVWTSSSGIKKQISWSAYSKVYEKIFQQAVKAGAMEKYHDLGTAANILPLNELGALPTRNLRETRFDRVENISGEAFARDTLVRKLACRGCPVGCIHLGLHRRAYTDRHDYQSVLLSYDYELIYALGTLLGIGDQQGIYRLLEVVEELGLDAISSGVALAWVTEALERGIITPGDTLSPVEFGQVEGYLQLLSNLVRRPNEFFRTLAQGAWEAAGKYGGEAFALVLERQEVAGYHTGYGSLFGQMIGARHSHLDNAGYSFDQEKEEKTPEELAEAILEEERVRCVLNSLSICLFARKLYTPPLLVEALDSIGYRVTEEGLRELGAQILAAKWEVKQRLGFIPGKQPISRRFLETPSFRGNLQEVQLTRMLKHFLHRVYH